MTAVTITQLQSVDVPSHLLSGSSPVRLVDVHLEVTSAGSSDTLILSTYLPGLQSIKGFMMVTLDGAEEGGVGTPNTWSGVTITFAGHAGSGVWKIIVRAAY